MDARRPRRCPRPSMTTTCRSRRRGDDGERTFAMARKNRGEPVPRARDRHAHAAGTSTRAREMASHRTRASTSASASVRRRRIARRRGASGSTLPGLRRVARQGLAQARRNTADPRPREARARDGVVGRRAEDKADTHLIHDVQLIRYACQRDRGKRARRPRRWRFSAEAELADGAMASGEAEPPPSAGYRVYFSLQVSEKANVLD